MGREIVSSREERNKRMTGRARTLLAQSSLRRKSLGLSAPSGMLSGMLFNDEREPSDALADRAQLYNRLARGQEGKPIEQSSHRSKCSRKQSHAGYMLTHTHDVSLVQPAHQQLRKGNRPPPICIMKRSRDGRTDVSRSRLRGTRQKNSHFFDMFSTCFRQPRKRIEATNSDSEFLAPAKLATLRRRASHQPRQAQQIRCQGRGRRTIAAQLHQARQRV